MKFQER